MTSDRELLPCPFCSGAASLMLCGFGTARVTCNECGSEGQYCRSHEAAITAWNQRPAARRAQGADMLAVCEALGFDPTNHHNAAKCPYCRPAEGADKLHDAIMNLPCKPYDGTDAYTHYCRGHRDARHAAADLALSVIPEQPGEVMAGCTNSEQGEVEKNAARYAWLRSLNDGDFAIFEMDEDGKPKPLGILIGSHADAAIDAAIGNQGGAALEGKEGPHDR